MRAALERADTVELRRTTSKGSDLEAVTAGNHAIANFSRVARDRCSRRLRAGGGFFARLTAAASQARLVEPAWLRKREINALKSP